MFILRPYHAMPHSTSGVYLAVALQTTHSKSEHSNGTQRFSIERPTGRSMISICLSKPTGQVIWLVQGGDVARSTSSKMRRLGRGACQSMGARNAEPRVHIRRFHLDFCAQLVGEVVMRRVVAYESWWRRTERHTVLLLTKISHICRNLNTLIIM